MQETLVLIKPDAIHRKLVGKIISIYEENGLKIEDAYMCQPDPELLEAHYQEHKGKDFYETLLKFMSSAEVMVMLLKGENAVNVVREINGATNPANARPCTIRYLFGANVTQNAVHGSASIEDALREIALWFPNDEV